jgi:hypothetical protein
MIAEDKLYDNVAGLCIWCVGYKYMLSNNVDIRYPIPFPTITNLL